MRLAKGVALVLGFVAAVVLGVWIGPHVTHRGAVVGDTTGSPQASVSSVEKDLPGPTVKRAPSRRTAAKQRKAAETTPTGLPVGSTPRAISVIAPALHERLKP